MLKIQVKSAVIAERKIRMRDGGSFDVREQDGWIEYPNGEVRRFSIPLQEKQEAFKVGFWVLGAESFTVNNYGGLELARVFAMEPAPAAQIRAAS